MPTRRLPDQELLDMRIQGKNAVLSVLPDGKEPQVGDFVHSESYGVWQVIRVLEESEERCCTDLLVSFVQHSDGENWPRQD